MSLLPLGSSFGSQPVSSTPPATRDSAPSGALPSPDSPDFVKLSEESIKKFSAEKGIDVDEKALHAALEHIAKAGPQGMSGLRLYENGKVTFDEGPGPDSDSIDNSGPQLKDGDPLTPELKEDFVKRSVNDMMKSLSGQGVKVDEKALTDALTKMADTQKVGVASTQAIKIGNDGQVSVIDLDPASANKATGNNVDTVA